MSEALLHLHHRRLNQHLACCNSVGLFLNKSCFSLQNRVAFRTRKPYSSPVFCNSVEYAGSSFREKDSSYDGQNFIHFPHVQTLSNFPVEELFGKVVMVRLDPVILPLQQKENLRTLPTKALTTVKYLYEAGSKVILVGSWCEGASSGVHSEACHFTESVADFLSSMLGIKVVPVKYISESMHNGEEDKKSEIILLDNLSHSKGEVANSSIFAKKLSYGVDIFVNDTFSEAHKILASTVGVACFCFACMAGFYFEEELQKIKKIVQPSERPYMAIIGGGNFADKATSLQVLASVCDGLVFTGSMAFQIMHALGIPVPMNLVEPRALKEALDFVELAKSRGTQIIFPKDVWCIEDKRPNQKKIFSIHSVVEAWQPVDIGPTSVQELTNILKSCKKITWIGPLKFNSSVNDKCGTVQLAEAISALGQGSCDVTFVGKMESTRLFEKFVSSRNVHFVKNAAVAWKVLKGGKLPGLMALDRAYPSHVDWRVAYADPTRPLVVDIGSGNGLFVFGMARQKTDMNFLGLEMNTKLVDRCLGSIHEPGVENVFFIATNATSTFRSIVSSYPGILALVSIQCPNPDFNKPEYRWRMLQRSLVEAIADLLVFGGKVFLQSDIEAVATRMKKELIKYSKGKLEVEACSEDYPITQVGWLKSNPFGVPSDWERHVLDRGDPMFRLLITKVKRDSLK